MPRYFGSSLCLLRKLGIITAACLCLLFLLLFVNRAHADENIVVPDAPGSIAGIVTNGVTGAPLAGIEITVFQQLNPGGWQQIRVLLTDASGAYKATLLGAGIYRILASDPKGVLAQTYYAGATVLELATDVPVAGVNVKDINLQLGLGGGITGTITSTITSMLLPTTRGGGNPSVLSVFQKAGTRWDNVRTIPIFTDQKEYSVTGLPAGVYRICTGGGYFSSSYNPTQECYANVYAIDDGFDVAVNAGAITPNINFILGDGADLAQIVGNIADADGKPLAKVGVSAQRITTSPYGIGSWSQYTQTNNVGVYRLLNLLPGAYTISFLAPSGDYVSEIYSNVLSINPFFSVQGTPVTVVRYETHPGINANLAPASYVSGVVTLAGAPIQQPGSVAVEYKSKLGWEPFYQFYNGFDNGNVDQRTGQYKIGGLPAGVYRLSANTAVGSAYYQGFYGGKTMEDAAPVTLTVGETRTNLTIALNQSFSGPPYSGQISGTVTAKGAPVSGVKVALYQNNCCSVFPPMATANDVKPLIYVYTDAKGHYTIDGLVDGNYYLGISDPKGVYATTYYKEHLSLQSADSFFLRGNRAVFPKDMSDLPATVELVEGGGISGRVHLKNAAGVANLAVGVFVNDQSYGWTLVTVDDQTDADGNFTVKGLKAGLYQLCFGDSTATYPVECYGAGVQNNFPGAGSDIAVLPGKITGNINQVLGPKESTFLPLVQQNRPPATYFNVVTVSQCEPQAAGNWFEGTTSINGQPKNGYKVVFSYAPDGPPITAPVQSGPHEGYSGWKTGYYSHIIHAQGPIAGDWYVWIVDERGKRISEIADWVSTGPGKGCNQAVVDFDSR